MIDTNKQIELYCQFVQELPGIAFLKDLNLTVRAANKTICEYVGVTADGIVGLTNYDVMRNDLFANVYEEQDKVILQTGEQSFLDLVLYPDDQLRIIAHTKKMVSINSQNVGILCQGIDLTTSMSKVGELLFTYTKHIVNPKQKPFSFSIAKSEASVGRYQLSEREHECVFLMLRGKTVKDIAKVLCLSMKTIESYMDNIKFKFGCRTKGELIEKAIDAGYLFILPKSLFSM